MNIPLSVDFDLSYDPVARDWLCRFALRYEDGTHTRQTWVTQAGRQDRQAVLDKVEFEFLRTGLAYGMMSPQDSYQIFNKMTAASSQTSPQGWASVWVRWNGSDMGVVNSAVGALGVGQDPLRDIQNRSTTTPDTLQDQSVPNSDQDILDLIPF